MAVYVQGQPVGDCPRVLPEARRGTPRRITEIGEEILARPCRAAAEFGTPELSALIDDMFATLYVAEGAGLAANQVGVDLRLFVWDCWDEYGDRHIGHILNPVLDEEPVDSRRLIEAPEGCLSVPGPYAKLPRADHAVVRGVDQDGQPLVVEGRGYFARCLQHETDHLGGGLYVDRLPLRKRKSVLHDMAKSRDEVLARRAELADELRRSRTLEGR
ncbi:MULTISPECIES: peptide deformylase [Amycolatopsis]|uniref:Peptide deformylase n=1 Tax=Amycolatopsis tucumanensis TaxID=401106 RepID=A0ABP7IF14_9PSEU|nr:peptide deformylase [Amycolatopsis tucumanensis]MCF6429234.1 peptide deformylase [Amycolatopsis tucumanensis]